MNKWGRGVEMLIDKWARSVKFMMKEETSLSLTLEPEQIFSSVGELMNERRGDLP